MATKTKDNEGLSDEEFAKVLEKMGERTLSERIFYSKYATYIPLGICILWMVAVFLWVLNGVPLK